MLGQAPQSGMGMFLAYQTDTVRLYAVAEEPRGGEDKEARHEAESDGPPSHQSQSQTRDIMFTPAEGF